jgi:hypothetical protein
MLDDAQRQLEARFTELAAMRNPLDYPVYALEHGLESDQVEAIAKAASLELRQSGLRKAHWLVWAALAAEAGYRYAGEEYWPALERARGEWRSNDFRDRLRTWFRAFHTTYGGPVPKGRWAAHFNIIAWPINNAILPRYLQDHFARHLYNLRYELAHRAQADPTKIGPFLLDRYDGSSSRFAYFLQQTELTTMLVLALREEDSGALPRISPTLLTRIVADLEAKRLARDYLREARTVIRTRKFALSQPLRTGTAPASGAGSGQPAVIPGPKLAAKLVADRGLSLALIVPDFAAALSRAGFNAAALRGVRMRLPGDAERWTPASNLLTLAGQPREIATFPPSAAPVIELHGETQPLRMILDPLCQLEERPCWVLRRFDDGLYRQVVQGHVRPGHAYLILSRGPLPDGDVGRAGLVPLPVTLPNMVAYRLKVADRMADDQAAALARLTIGSKAAIWVEPAGLAPRPAGTDTVACWLSIEPVILRLRADHEVSGFIARLDGAEPERIATGTNDVLLALGDLSLGQHQLELAAIPSRSQSAAAGTIATMTFAFEVAAPQPWSEAVRAKAGFRLVVSPTNAPLEEVLAGRAQLSVIGPAGRQVQWSLDTFDAGGNLATTSRGGVTGTRATEADITRVVARLRSANSEAIDRAHRVDISAAIDELGVHTLRFPHAVEPLRWKFEPKQRVVRLIDETSHEEPIEVTGLPLAAPLERIALAAAALVEGQAVESPGMLLTARYLGRSQTALVSVPASATLHSFAELDLVQRFDLPVRDAEALLLLVRTLALWTPAHALGHLAIVRKAVTVDKLRDKVAALAAGADFASLLKNGGPAALKAAREMVGGSPGFRSRMCSHAWDVSLRDSIPAFASYASTYQVETDAKRAAAALALAFDPLRLRFGYGSEAEAKAERLLANRTLLRGAYLARAHARDHPDDDAIAVAS